MLFIDEHFGGKSRAHIEGGSHVQERTRFFLNSIVFGDIGHSGTHVFGNHRIFLSASIFVLDAFDLLDVEDAALRVVCELLLIKFRTFERVAGLICESRLIRRALVFFPDKYLGYLHVFAVHRFQIENWL